MNARLWLERDDVNSRCIAAEWRRRALSNASQTRGREEIDYVFARLVSEWVDANRDYATNPCTPERERCRAAMDHAASTGKPAYVLEAPNDEHAAAGLLASIVLFPPNLKRSWESES